MSHRRDNCQFENGERESESNSCDQTGNERSRLLVEEMQSSVRKNRCIEQRLSVLKCRTRWTRAAVTVESVDFAKSSQLLSIHVQMG